MRHFTSGSAFCIVLYVRIPCGHLDARPLIWHGVAWQSDVGLGTIIGSAVFNILIIIGATAIIVGDAHPHLATRTAPPSAVRLTVYGWA